MAKSVKGVKLAGKSVRHSAGLLMYRKRADGTEVFLAHPGGPIWAKRDKGAWTIPKGRYEGTETPLDAAKREFNEETGFVAKGPFVELGSVTQKSGKVVTGWAFQGDCDPAKLTSNTCELEWPPRSGKRIEIPEVDRGAWFGLAAARQYIREEQVALVDVLDALLLRRNLSERGVLVLPSTDAGIIEYSLDEYGHARIVRTCRMITRPG